MTSQSDRAAAPRGRRPKRPSSYSEQLDESPKLLETEPVDVEESTPAEERQSVESPPPDERTPPVFEE
ncbi:hypothetical protein SAMN06265365_11652 [Tistlia consotensis]|uniref:Uncharacterized protein n=1 Tax=Tistlia consotensis USBA 355 TaxID=560819 RepID=A0A1Y6C7W9_9PROT|nr:hypothetical protein [Tistlia consotensis]SMF48415.1 hypothetical protein SAMN05428998_11785 [Tistlia consotensis USBA 355]SNR81242.1 hypothetical protein SAMN06265365_11652 [Tistlia consotensis]